MVISTHATYGMLSARFARTGTLGSGVLGMLSHLALDSIPHQDYNYRQHHGLYTALDFALAHFLILQFAQSKQERVAGILGYGVDPTVMLLRKTDLHWPVLLHDQCHAQKSLSKKQSLLLQSTMVAAALGLLWFLPRR